MQADRAADLRFLVVGSGRSGTAYASALFSGLGIPCGHEAVFGWGGRPADGLLGDASFCAVPFLPGFTGVVFHQVRHPLAILRSVVATGFFADPGAYVPHLDLIEQTLPELGRLEGPLRKAICFVVRWNRLCEPFADLRWKVEDLDPTTLCEAARRVGVERSLEQCSAALAAVPTDVNSLEGHGLQRIGLGWRDIPPGRDKDELLELTHDYGYEP